jgi:adenylosuccinate lyase
MEFDGRKNTMKKNLTSAHMDYSTFQSPFSWRYGSGEMRTIFSEKHKFEIWRRIWVTLARVESDAGLLTKKELQDLVANQNDIDIDRISEIEKDTKHDVVAAIKEFAEKAKVGGGKIHLGATSMDVVDNADAMKMKEAIKVIKDRGIGVLSLLAEKIKTYAEFPCIGYTHLQPAEPTTVGYRFASYAQDILNALHFLDFAEKMMKGKGMKGAVGTAASYKEMLAKSKMTVNTLDTRVMDALGLDSCLITTQVYPRQSDYILLSALAAVSAAIAKFAGDLRILQSPNFGEWSEGFGKLQVGSSAMPFKKNPISAENICSLSRFVATLPIVALENATLSYLERTLDDSANKRIIMAEAFLATDQILMTSEKILAGIVINEKRITANLSMYAPFSATESILTAAVARGANRQLMHESLRNISMVAWKDIQEGKSNPMEQLLSRDAQISKYLTSKEIVKLLDVSFHIGDAPKRALQLIPMIKAYEK